MKKILVISFLLIQIVGQTFSQSVRKENDLPFLFGAQYYRAPTPEKENWERDLKRMHELGFTDVKYWVQWRWSHRSPDKFYYGDLDTLMNLASKYQLKVTINIICDVTPLWLFKKYPDAKQIRADGQAVEPYAPASRQIGGHPGPCYNHPGALDERKKFVANLVNHFKDHPAFLMWDVWNEPELSAPSRNPDMNTMVCYCPNCQNKFVEWLKAKYQTIGQLNKIWGRWYDTWEEVEMPRSTATFQDFIDWRNFNNDVMLEEAKWRIQLTKQLDPKHTVYLHVVPNIWWPWNAVTTCMDDFDVAKLCDVFASTMSWGPVSAPQIVSAGNGRTCYNVESHINAGCTNAHQAIINLPGLLDDLIPQIGLGIKGFLFWQFRAENLGFEAPAWGMVNIDGSDRTITKAVDQFWKTLSPYKTELMTADPKPAEIAIWKSRGNEIFHYCMFFNFESLSNSINKYSKAIFDRSYNYRYINSEMLEKKQLQGIKLLIMPTCYYLSEGEAKALDEWVKNGGILLNEAHLGGYNANTGRHSGIIPAFGLAESWGIREIESTSSWRLKLNQNEAMNMNITDDLKKALKESGASGSKNFPIKLKSGKIAWSSYRYAMLDAPGAESIGYFSEDSPCIVLKKVGKGAVLYCGANIAEGSEKDAAGFNEILDRAINEAGISKTLELNGNSESVRIDALYSNKELKFITIKNMSENNETIKIKISGIYKGLFSNKEINGYKEVIIEKGFCDIFRKL
jgi:beta-galactosidase